MSASIGILLAAAVIVLMEVPPLLKEKRKKELTVFSVLLAVATGFSIAEALHAPLPYLFDLLMPIFKPVNDWILSLL